MLALCAAWAVPAAAQSPTPGPPQRLDGPTPDIPRPAALGLAVARDGGGGLVYLKDVSGVPHVFVSILAGGSFQSPRRIDSTLGAASSQPVIAASSGGLLLVAFVNGGELYVVGRASASGPLAAPQPIASGAANPAISVSIFGKAYLAFTQASGGGYDVHTAYYYRGQWALESPPLNASPGDDAGSGAGAGPAVGAAGDGVGIVAWREEGHIHSRRVWATAPSVIDEQADSPVGGCGEDTVENPRVGVEGDSSFVDVLWQEILTCGSQQQSRVLMNRLRGSQYDGLTSPDGLSTPSTASADQPQIAMGEYGDGYVTSARASSDSGDANQLFATGLTGNGSSGPLLRVDSLGNSSPPDAVPGNAGLHSYLIAWQQNGGGSPEIRARYSAAGTLGGQLVLSSPADGPTDAASGLAAGGDSAGDAAAAWIQGGSNATQIVTDQLYQGPGSFAAVHAFRYAARAHPKLTWAAPSGSWGPMHYLLTVDRKVIAQTTSTSIVVPRKLRNGIHTWHVTAINRAGLRRTSPTAKVFVDTVAPTLSFTVTGSEQAGAAIHIAISARDRPPRGLPASDASGVAKVTIKWGDGHVSRSRHGASHVYRRPGRYKVTVTVFDRAGNRTRRVRFLQVG